MCQEDVKVVKYCEILQDVGARTLYEPSVSETDK